MGTLGLITSVQNAEATSVILWHTWYVPVCPTLATPLVCCAMLYSLRSIAVWYLRIVHLKVRIGDV